ncbi:MAG: EamA family transporter [Eubacteriales bacterium]
MNFGKKQIEIISALLVVYIFWGGTYLGMKIGIETIPPFMLAGFRFLIAGIILYVYATLRGASKPTFENWKTSGIIGALLLLGGNGIVCWAEQTVPSGIAALLIATVPLWIMLIGFFGREKTRHSFGSMAGVALGLVGIAILVLPNMLYQQSNSSIDPIGLFAIIFASFSWSLGSLYSRKATHHSSALLSNGMQMILGGIFLLIVAYFMGDFSNFHIQNVSIRSMLGFWYLVIFGSIIAYSSFIWLLKNTEPLWVSTYAFVNPVVAVFLGYFLAGEVLGLNSIISSIIIILSVVIITVFKR